MKIFEIRDGASALVRGYLFYYERSGRFYAELPDQLNEWDVPAMFYGHAKRCEYSVDHNWAMKWVRQRIIPAERQNIASILKANHLRVYDEYRLLRLSEGRCAQDDDHIVEIDAGMLPEKITLRLMRKLEDVLPLSGFRILAFFRDGNTRLIELKKFLRDERMFSAILSDEERFLHVKLSPGGNGIEWDAERFIAAEQLYAAGHEIALRREDLLTFARERLLDTSKLSERLGVSRQYIKQLTDKDKLHPVLSTAATQFYAAAEIESE